MFLLRAGSVQDTCEKKNALRSNGRFPTTLIRRFYVIFFYVILCSIEIFPDYSVNPQHKDTSRTRSPL